MRRRKALCLLGLVVLWSLPLLWGCRGGWSHEGALEIVGRTEIREDGLLTLQGLGLSRSEMETQAQERLTRSRWFAFVGTASGKRPAYRLRFRVRLRSIRSNRRPSQSIEEEEKKPRFRLVFATEIAPLAGQGSPFLLRQERILRKFESSYMDLPIFQKAIQATWDAHLRSLVAFAVLRRQPTQGLIQALASADPEVRRQSAACLGERSESSAVTALLRALQDPDAAVLSAAITSLSRLRAKDAVIPLIQLVPGRDALFFLQILSALAEIGGIHALAFLDMVATAHDNRAVRRSALEAFQELRQRRDP